MTEHLEHLKSFVDGLSISLVLTTLMGWVPNATAVLSLVWIVIRLYETKTVRTFVKWLKGDFDG